jgi:orotidine-5'-phosphate decarboxylase
MASEGFGSQLSHAIATTSPLCVGLDPSSTLLDAWGFHDDAQALESMGQTVIEAAQGVAAAIKPQVAYFERHGARGIAALENVLRIAREAGLLVIADAKRGDIDATMDAYGHAWIGEDAPLRADALTVMPYMGLGAMEAVFERAERYGAGIFCVVASSNREGRSIQTAQGLESSVEAMVLADLAQRNRNYCNQTGGTFGPFGAVVGATREAGELDLGSLGGCFLVPGYGAQGASAEDVAALFGSAPAHSVLVNSSRAILSKGPDHRSIRTEIANQAEMLSQALRG